MSDIKKYEFNGQILLVIDGRVYFEARPVEENPEDKPRKYKKKSQGGGRGRRIDEDTKKKILDAKSEGRSASDISEEFGVSTAFIYKITKDVHEEPGEKGVKTYECERCHTRQKSFKKVFECFNCQGEMSLVKNQK